MLMFTPSKKNQTILFMFSWHFIFAAIHLVEEKLKPPITNTSDIEGIESDPYDPGRGGTTSATLL